MRAAFCVRSVGPRQLSMMSSVRHLLASVGVRLEYNGFAFRITLI